MSHHNQTVEIYNKYSKAYLDKFMHFDLYNDTFDFFLTLLPTKAHVLELGCGPGNVIRYFHDRRNDLIISGLDLAPEMLKLAKTINPEAEFEVMDLRHINKISKKYEALIAAFCLPYLSYEDLNKFFIDCSALLHHDGIMYVSCMEGPVEKSGFEKTSFTEDSDLFIYYHQADNLETLLLKNDLVTEKFYTKQYAEADGSFTTDLIYILRKVGK